MVKDRKIVTRNVDGLEGEYLQRLSDWDRDVAVALAAQDKLNLEDLHWRIIDNIRDYYREYQAFPSNKVFREYILHPLEISFETFQALFPKGLHQACRISGIALPTGYGNISLWE